MWFQLLIFNLSLGLFLSIHGHLRRPHDLEVVFFDVGQGDAALVRFPDGANWLVDAGGGWKENDVGKTVLIPELARWGIFVLDAAVVSHTDLDHVFGFPTLLDRLTIKNLYLHSDVRTASTPGAKKLRASWGPTTLHEIARTEEFSRHGVQLKFIPLTAGRSTNDRALILSIEYRGCSVLFTGDVERAGEDELLEKIKSRTHLLKTPHHGSATSNSEAFLNRTDPEWTVISVGRNNHYGHPTRTVLERLKRKGVQTLRTDFHGFVRFRFSAGGVAYCDSFWGPCGTSVCQPH